VKGVGGIKDAIIDHSTHLISLVMVVVTLLCPVSVVLTDAGYSDAEGYWGDLMVIAVLWAYFPAHHHSDSWGLGVKEYGLFPLNPTILSITFPIWFLTILFAAQVIRYHTDDIPRRNVMLVGYLSLIPPTILGLYGSIFVIQWSIFTYVGPIPIQFIVGYALVRFSHRLKTETESNQERIDEEKKEKSWWKSQNDAEDTSQETIIPSFRSRMELIIANLKDHPVRSVIIIGLFIVYLPIVYQIHLNMVATKVSVSGSMYFWRFTGCSFFPIPVDYAWLGVVTDAAYIQLAPFDVFIYTRFYPSIAPRVMWSILWLTLGIIYIISPLLKSRDNT
jgi:hypothetical protein